MTIVHAVRVDVLLFVRKLMYSLRSPSFNNITCDFYTIKSVPDSH